LYCLIFLKKICRWLLKVAIIFFALSIISVVLFRFVPVPFTPLMVTRSAEQLFNKEKIKLKKQWLSLGEMSANMPTAVICSEDQHFKEHNGFDFEAIKKAMDHNNRKKKKGIRGASTISQQVAKNVFLWQGRSWLRKGLEAYFTVLIELCWSKERIMEVYLNVIEMGKGIYGAQAASANFFGKVAKRLSQGEAALIAAVLPNPIRWSPAHPTNYIYKRQRWILRQMSYNGNKIDLSEEEPEEED